MSKRKIALALYTIRDKLKTPADYATCLKRVKQIGYEGVEGSAIDPSIDAKEYRKILDGEGLVLCCCHAGEPDLRERFSKVVEWAKTLGCPTIGFPYLSDAYWSEAGIVKIATFLDETGEKLRKEGIRFVYHNHHMEFNRVGTKTFLELIYERTRRDHLGAQLDTYWVQHGGADPADWIRRMKGRTRHLHCKDMVMIGSECAFAEIGEGNLNWPPIMKAARDVGIEWCIVEQDSSRRDTLESAAISFKALQKMVG